MRRTSRRVGTDEVGAAWKRKGSWLVHGGTALALVAFFSIGMLNSCIDCQTRAPHSTAVGSSIIEQAGQSTRLAGLVASARQKAWDVVLVTVPTGNVAQTKLLEHGAVGGHLMLKQAAYMVVSLQLSIAPGHGLVHTLLLIVALTVTDPIRAVFLFRMTAAHLSGVPAAVPSSLTRNSASIRSSSHISGHNPAMVGRWGRHRPVLTIAVRIHRLDGQTLLGSNTVFIRHVSGRRALVAILPGTLTGDVGDIDGKLETRERKSTLHNIERATGPHGTKAGHALGITWRKNAWCRTNIDMDRKLVNSNKRNKGTIRSGAEKLRTERGGHDAAIRSPELDFDT